MQYRKGEAAGSWDRKMTTTEAYENIISRRSVRRYTEEPVSDETMSQILRAAMNAPSCVNARDWSFIVVRDRETMNKMADGNGGPAEPLRHAAAGILVCGDLSRSFPPAKDYWIIDAASPITIIITSEFCSKNPSSI